MTLTVPTARASVDCWLDGAWVGAGAVAEDSWVAREATSGVLDKASTGAGVAEGVGVTTAVGLTVGVGLTTMTGAGVGVAGGSTGFVGVGTSREKGISVLAGTV